MICKKIKKKLKKNLFEKYIYKIYVSIWSNSKNYHAYL